MSILGHDSAEDKWRQLKSIGKFRFVVLARGICGGLPIGVVYMLLFGHVDRSDWRNIFSIQFLLPVSAAVVVAALIGLGEWHAARDAAGHSTSPEE